MERILAGVPGVESGNWGREFVVNNEPRAVKASANVRNYTQHCWAQQCCLLMPDVCKRSQQVPTCWVFR